jgi:AraC-like DNA-binding protein
MASMSDQETKRDVFRAHANREELSERIARVLPIEGKIEPIPGLYFARVSKPTKGLFGVFPPSLCLVAQGCKEVFLGDRLYRYDPYHYLITTIALPFQSQVIEASAAAPYLSLRLVLDPTLVSSVMLETGGGVGRSDVDVRGMDVEPLDAELLDAVTRLVRLLDAPPETAAVLRPLFTREIVYRLLTGEQGARLRHIAVLSGHRHRIASAVELLHREYDRPIRIDRVARELGMSVSGFHHQFKAVTGMSPLQFQKQLRLQEARRLMIGEDLDAATAGYRVGYDNPSHFSREYKRLFGEPPRRDVDRVREAAVESAR